MSNRHHSARPPSAVRPNVNSKPKPAELSAARPRRPVEVDAVPAAVKALARDCDDPDVGRDDCEEASIKLS